MSWWIAFFAVLAIGAILGAAVRREFAREEEWLISSIIYGAASGVVVGAVLFFSTAIVIIWSFWTLVAIVVGICIILFPFLCLGAIMRPGRL